MEKSAGGKPKMKTFAESNKSKKSKKKSKAKKVETVKEKEEDDVEPQMNSA